MPIHPTDMTLIWEEARNRGLPSTGCLIHVSVRLQELTLLHQAGSWQTPCSTAAAGTGAEPGSFKTPLGWHRITEWIGDSHPPGTVFKSREPTGEVRPPTGWRSEESEDGILTRILWLDGMEPGVNDTSHARYIYIHGTHQEQRLGHPASQGCIRVGNLAMLHLFDLTSDHPTYCLISDD